MERPNAPRTATSHETPRHQGHAHGWSLRTASLTAGIGLLLMAALAGISYTLAVQGLVSPDDAARTAADITASEGLFRLGIAGLLVVVALDVIVAWALYRVFASTSRSVATLAATLRYVYAGIFLVAIAHLITAVDVLGSTEHLARLGTEQLQATVLMEVEAFDDVWNAGLLLFGMHLCLIGYLAYRSDPVPRVLGVLLGLAGIGYVVDSLVPVVTGGSSPEVSMFTFIGELLLAFWLTFRSRHIAAKEEGADPAPGLARSS